MALLDNILGGLGGSGRASTGKPGLGSTVAAGVVLALLVKAVRTYQAHETAQATSGPTATAASPDQAGGGLLGGLAGGGLADILRNLGGAGALGALISQFQHKGQGGKAASWVGTDQNQPIAPHEIAAALGENTIDDLQLHTGMSRENLLSELSENLPQAISEATPQGRLPDDQELHQIASGK